MTTQRQILTGSAIFDGETVHTKATLVLENGHIAAILPNSSVLPKGELIELAGGLIAPGFIDLQVNGGGGVLFNSSPTPQAIATMINAHRRGGTTGMLPTFITDSSDKQKQALEAYNSAQSDNQLGLLGLHLEGPFFSEVKRGVHHLDYIRPLTDEDCHALCAQAAHSGSLMLTLAPEQCTAAQVAMLTSAGVIVSIGHSNANYEHAIKMVNAGASAFTHLFNAMSSMESRAPNVVGAALTSDQCWCGIIADNIHVHGANIALAAKAKPQGKLFLVTDAMSTVFSDIKSFDLYGETIHQQQNYLVNGEGKLAGSAISMIDAVNTCIHHAGIPLEEALRMASLYPAQLIGHGQLRGKLQPNFKADLVHLHCDNAGYYSVGSSWIAGQYQQHPQP